MTQVEFSPPLAPTLHPDDADALDAYFAWLEWDADWIWPDYSDVAD